jgi:membrane protease YdiL (CAAX protease family)
MVCLPGTEDSRMETNRITVKTFGISTLAIILGEVAAVLAMRNLTTDTTIILGAARLLETVILLMVVVRLEGTMSAVGLAPSGIVPGLMKGLLWSACFAAATSLVFAILFFVNINPIDIIRFTPPGGEKNTLLFVLVAGLIGPVAEEVFFRGIIYGFFRRWGIIAGIVASTLLFVLAHGDFSRIPITQVVGGVIFCLAYEAGGNLMVPLTIHVLGNLCIIALSLAAF